MIFKETRGSCQDWKEDDDEGSESVEEETWRVRADLVILHAIGNFLSSNMNIFFSYLR